MTDLLDLHRFTYAKRSQFYRNISSKSEALSLRPITRTVLVEDLVESLSVRIEDRSIYTWSFSDLQNRCRNILTVITQDSLRRAADTSWTSWAHDLQRRWGVLCAKTMGLYSWWIGNFMEFPKVVKKEAIMEYRNIHDVEVEIEIVKSVASGLKKSTALLVNLGRDYLSLQISKHGSPELSRFQRWRNGKSRGRLNMEQTGISPG